MLTCQCAIEVVNTGTRDGSAPSAVPGDLAGEDPADGFDLADDPVSVTAEHGRGLKIIDAVVDNLQLTGNKGQGTTVHFEKRLEWLPGAAGQHLLHLGGGA